MILRLNLKVLLDVETCFEFTASCIVLLDSALVLWSEVLHK